MRERDRLIYLLVFLVLIIPAAMAPDSRAASRPIHYLSVEGVINPVVAGFISKGIEEAEEGNAEAVVIELDTPGGLDLSMRTIIKAMLSARVPVVVYVAPAGSRAASAGVFITYAASVAAMAPGTNIGSAHPVALGMGGAQKMDETMARKVENDAVAYLKGIATKRGRNARWAEKAVRESVNVTAEEALRLGVIDVVARDRTELLSKLNGMRVSLPGGETRTLSTLNAAAVEVRMDLRERVLYAISNPNVAYILMMIGLIGLYFELSSPGAVLPGVIGALSLVLAFYSFQTLPVNYAGLILIVLAVVFFVIEVKVVSFGLLTLAGVVSLVLGSMMLFDSPAPFMRLSLRVMLPSVVFMTAFILLVMYGALRVHAKRPVSGAEGLVGDVGVALADMEPGVEGEIFIEGEYWRALCDSAVKKGEKVKVAGIDGLLLRVEGPGRKSR